MQAIFEPLLHADETILEVVEGVRWQPLTVLFVLLSGWWMKGFAFVALGALGDVRSRRVFPAASTFAAVSVLAGGLLTHLMKGSIDRARPEEASASLDAAVATPGSPSFPSGHTSTAFAAAAVVASLHPRLRWPVLALAACVGLSRIYLGVHFALDVVAGAALGLSVGLVAARLARRWQWKHAAPRQPAS
ncbi:MAG: phosphatase PAP2 family protein [Actinomycetota bacterium]|nr:phosphatase PAP2 family protein [Actinomycetota bacterium]